MAASEEASPSSTFANQPPSLGFSDAKFERRRPSKRQTTVRTFNIVRNWESETAVPETPEKGDSHKEPVCASPQFFPPSHPWPSARIPNTVVTSSTKTPRIQDNNNTTLPYSNVPVGPEGTGKVTSNNDTPTLDALSAMFVSDSLMHLEVLESPNNSIVIKNTPTIPAAPQTKTKTLNTEDIPEVSPASKHQHHSSSSAEAEIVKSRSSRATRGRKRKQDNVASEEATLLDNDDDQQYSEHKFVRIFNAGHGRNSTMADITDLDVVLTAIEEVALRIREESNSDQARYSIKEFFIQVRKSFGECIDMQNDLKMLKMEFRKENTRLKKLKGELLEVQKKRTRMRGNLAKLEKQTEENEKKSKDVLEISDYLYHMKDIQKKGLQRKPPNAFAQMDSSSSTKNLSSLLYQTKGLLSSTVRLRSINSSLEGWLRKTR